MVCAEPFDHGVVTTRSRRPAPAVEEITIRIDPRADPVSGRPPAIPPAEQEVAPKGTAAIRRQLALLQSQLVEAQGALSRELDGRAEDAERHDETQSRLEDAQRALEKSAAQLATSNMEHAKSVAAWETEREEARVALEAEQAKRSELESELKVASAHAETLSATVTTGEKQLGAQVSATKLAHQRIVDLETDLATKTEALSAESGERKRAEEHAARTERSLQEAQSRETVITERLETANRELMSTRVDREVHRDQAEHLSREIEQMRGAFDKAVRTRDSYREALTGLVSAERNLQNARRQAERTLGERAVPPPLPRTPSGAGGAPLPIDAARTRNSFLTIDLNEVDEVPNEQDRLPDSTSEPLTSGWSASPAHPPDDDDE